MTLPTIHMNGTAPEDLLREVETADSAICQALTTLHDMAPNARDYYPQGSDSFRKAADEQRARINRLVDCRTELLAIAEHIREQIHLRREMRRR